MKNFQLVLRAALAAIALWVVLPAVVWAQNAGVPEKQAATEPSWVAPYFLTGLGIGLGLLVVCRPSRRKNPDEVKDTGPA